MVDNKETKMPEKQRPGCRQVPSSNEADPPSEERSKELVAKLKANEEKLKKAGHVSTDWGKLTVDALNRHTSDPVWSAKYMRWLEYLGPGNWAPVAKADYERMQAEGIKAAPWDDE